MPLRDPSVANMRGWGIPVTFITINVSLIASFRISNAQSDQSVEDSNDRETTVLLDLATNIIPDDTA